MRFFYRISLIIAFSIFVLISCKHDQYSYRWFYASKKLHSDRDLLELNNLVRTASEHNLNGLVLSAGFDRLDLQPGHYFKRLYVLKDTCQKYGVEIIPIIFSVGYGSSVLAHDPNLAAGLPVKNLPFYVRNKEVKLILTPQIQILDGDFGSFRNKEASSLNFHDKPGEVSFEDRRIFKKGRSSLRFENFGRNRHGHGRLMKEFQVVSNRSYQITCYVKTDKLNPSSAFQVQVYSEENTLLNVIYPNLKSTSNWRKIEIPFNSLDQTLVKFYAGVWGGGKGKFWVDDVNIKELGLVNILDRPGAPFVVKSQSDNLIYEEGKDYNIIRGNNVDFFSLTSETKIKIPSGSKISENEKLSISYYHGIPVRGSQVSVCMSEPKLYEIWKKQAQLIKKHLNPGKYFLGMDEVRAGGNCQVCSERNLTLAQILGDCVTKQFDILKSVQPDAEIFIWSDMFDPNHNASKRHYLVEGDFNNSWNYIPKDLVVVCWNYSIRDKSLHHFSNNGFPVMAAAYYDADDLENPRGWLNSLGKIKNAKGIIYTSWQNKYDLLAPFGTLVAPKKEDEK